MATTCKNNLIDGARNRDCAQVGPPAHASRVLRCWIVVSSGRRTTQPRLVTVVNEMDREATMTTVSGVLAPMAPGIRRVAPAILGCVLVAARASQPTQSAPPGSLTPSAPPDARPSQVLASPSSPERGSPATVVPTGPPACTEA